MSFKITFKAKKPSRPANENIHDEAAWLFAHDWAEVGWPVSLWPRQKAVHYIYELVNKPWLPVRARSDSMLAWTHHHHETHSPQA